MRIGIITFPGSLDDVDAARAVRLAGGEPVVLWHADHDLKGVDAVVLPGGFSYGDYLRAGAIAARAPLMQDVVDRARDGMPVLGICNGFQVLCEAGLLPGALTRNSHLHFRNRDQALRIERADTVWTADYDEGQQIVVPVKNGEGRFVAAEADLDRIEGEGRVVARYVGGNPNGSSRDIAGVASGD
ncbi:MAG: phosphoribosylformylglycinamidine synthase subunit PurQ, partial [Actinomycetes bacterium]